MALAEYTPTEWVNGTTPAINATNLNHIEAGIKNVTDATLALEQDVLNLMPVGAIIMWAGVTVPTGWQLYTAMNDRFPMGAPLNTVGQTGGSVSSVANHTHADNFAIANDSHSHQFGRYALESQVQFQAGDVYGVEGTTTDVNTESDTHNHGITGTVGAVNTVGEADGNLPPFRRVAYIIKI